jgi:hypothetical protein
MDNLGLVEANSFREGIVVTIAYVQAQRIPQKTEAMEAWSHAKAFKAAGGIYPT